MLSSKAVIVIPARMASSRFPGKPLAMIAGKTMIRRVWEIAQKSALANRVIIATDDDDLAREVSSYAEVIMTSPACKTGTDRVAETLDRLDETYDVIFSLQGDAVLTPPWIIDGVLKTMLDDPSVGMATPAVKLEGKAKADFIESKLRGSSTGTTVVFDKNFNALYFSKTLIPFARENLTDRPVYRHIGLYAYKPEILKQLSQLPQTPLEKVEQLEQLRALENGMPIRVALVDYRGRTHGSVDKPDDVQTVETIIANERELI